jgi:hypothetical protein
MKNPPVRAGGREGAAARTMRAVVKGRTVIPTIHSPATRGATLKWLTQHVAVSLDPIRIYSVDALNWRVSTAAKGQKTMVKQPATRVGYRDAKDGQFISKESFDRRKPENTIKERIPLPGRGDTKK